MVAKIEEVTASSMTILASGNIALNIFLSFGLKFLWNLVNTLQFMCYIPRWKLNFPSNALGVLNYLKMIALMEFIPTKKITDWASD